MTLVTIARSTRIASRARPIRYDGWLFVISMMVASACGGSSTAPARHPIGETYERNAARIDRIELIVDDPTRAARVRQCYVEIEALLRNFRGELVALKQNLVRQKWDDSVSDEQIRQLFAKHRQRRGELARRYVELQLEIRKNTTADEFRKIDRLR